MSAVVLLCADRPLPLYGPGPGRAHAAGPAAAEGDGFSVQAHEYYRAAVEDLGLPMKPFRYELDLEATEGAAARLRAYLRKNLRPGEAVELWNLWVGDGAVRPRRFSGALGDVAADTLEQLAEGSQTCLTVEI